MQGWFDVCNREALWGWAFDPEQPGEPVQLEIWCDGQLIGHVQAAQYRADLEATGYLGDGRCAFRCVWAVPPNPFAAHIIDVRRASDGMPLPGSPHILAAVTTLGDIGRDGLSRVVLDFAKTATDATEVDAAIGYLLRQVDTLSAARVRLGGQTDNDEALRRRWRGDAETPAIAPATSSLSPRALFIDERFPITGDNAGANAALDHMRSLKRIGFDVHFAAAKDFIDEQGYARKLIARGITVLTSPWYASIEEILRRHAGQFEFIYMHRADVAAGYAKLARLYCPKALLVYSVADLHHLRVARQAELQRRSTLVQLARELQRDELIGARYADVVISHSLVEAELLQRALPGLRVAVVPWAVATHCTSRDFSSRNGVVFVGNFGHEPNIDALQFLATTVLPWARRKAPGIPFRVIGSNMTPALHRLAQSGLEIVGAADDLNDIYGTARLSIAPLRYGAGLKGKVLESLAAGVPCIGTPIAYEGMDLPPSLAGCIADTGEAMVDVIARLYEDPVAHAETATAAQRYASITFGEAAVDAQLRQVVMPVLQRWAGLSPTA